MVINPMRFFKVDYTERTIQFKSKYKIITKELILFLISVDHSMISPEALKWFICLLPPPELPTETSAEIPI